MYDTYSLYFYTSSNLFFIKENKGSRMETDAKTAETGRLTYPQPIPVITGTIIPYDPENYERIVMVELQTNPGEAPPPNGEEVLVLPGGIFDHARHRDPLETGVTELLEETGLVAQEEAIHWGIDLRKNRDRRSFRGMQTDHCCDFLLAVPVRGEFRPQDVEEVKRATWVLARSLREERVGRGHFPTIQAWLKWMDETRSSLVYLRGNR